MEIISLFVSVSAMILKYILKKQTSKFITDKVEFKYALTQSLNNSYNALIESELVCFDGEGAIDHSFFKDERVINEIRDKMLDPSCDEDIDFDILYKIYEEIWVNSDKFPKEFKLKQHQGIQVLAHGSVVDV